MRRAIFVIGTTACFVSFAGGCGAEKSAPVATAPPARTAHGMNESDGAALVALEAAQSHGEYIVGLFYRELTDAVRGAERSLLAAIAASDGRAQYLSVDLSASGNDGILQRLDLGRIPLPAVVIVAPSGGVTKTLLVEGTGTIATNTVLDALVTPAHAQVLAALQAGKLAVLVLQPDAAPAVDALVREQGVSANFLAVTVDPAESFLAKFKDEAVLPLPSLLVLAPPGKELGRLSLGVTKAAILEILQRGAAP